MDDNERTPATRRRFLAATGLGALGTVGVAGCMGLGGSGSEATATATAVPEPLAPPTRGGGDVTLTVYADFACPACQTFHEDFVPSLEEEYVDPGVVTYEHRDYPLEMHAPRSYDAANAARAVQNATGDETFFAYVDSLFANQRRLSPDVYQSLAGEVDVDGERVRAAVESRRYRRTVSRDLDVGDEAGVRGTPAVFVDGAGPIDLSLEAIRDAIEAARSQDS
jgi:protein-disulfide isomerase